MTTSKGNRAATIRRTLKTQEGVFNITNNQTKQETASLEFCYGKSV